MSYSRIFPKFISLDLARALMAANIPFTMESMGNDHDLRFTCTNQRTLDFAADSVASRLGYVTGPRLRVALDTEISGPCHMPQGHPTHCGCLTP